MTLNEMKSVDIRTIDKENLVDLKTVQFSTAENYLERISDLKKQLRNLYAYKVGDVAVLSVYQDTDFSINDAFAALLFSSL